MHYCRGHDTAMPRPRYGVIGPRYRPRHGRHARSHSLASGGHDTKFCIVAEWGDLWVAIQRNKTAIWRRMYHDTALCVRDTACGRELCCDTNLYRDRGELRHGPLARAYAQRHGRPQAATRPGHCHDTAPVCATTRHDTAGLGVVHAQWVRSQGPLGEHPVHLT